MYMKLKSYHGFAFIFWAAVLLGNFMILASAYFHYWPLLIFTVLCSCLCWISRHFYIESKIKNL